VDLCPAIEGTVILLDEKISGGGSSLPSVVFLLGDPDEGKQVQRPGRLTGRSSASAIDNVVMRMMTKELRAGNTALAAAVQR
jgi:hypothetical protein